MVVEIHHEIVLVGVRLEEAHLVLLVEAAELILRKPSELLLELVALYELVPYVVVLGAWVEGWGHIHIIFVVRVHGCVLLELACVTDVVLLGLLLLRRHHLQVEHDLLDIVDWLAELMAWSELLVLVLHVVEVETAHGLLHLLVLVSEITVKIILVWHKN